MENGGTNGSIVEVEAPERDTYGRFLRLPGPGRGHRRLPKSIKEAALLHAPQALNRLVEIMSGDDVAEARMAASVVLAYAIGAPYRQRPPVEDGEVARSLLAEINARRSAIEAAEASRTQEAADKDEG
jgi:hypothetical protein